MGLPPHDLPSKGATYYYFAKWRDDGTDKTIHDLLRWHLREKKKRLADPNLVVLDTQSVHVAAGVSASATGKDAAKRVPGRKRGLAVDVLGLVIPVVVLAASTHDNAAGIARVAAVTEGAVTKALVDQGFKNTVVAHGAAGDRGRHRRTQPRRQRVRPPAEALDRRADLRNLDVPPAPGPRLRAPSLQFRITGVLGNDGCDVPPSDPCRPVLAVDMTRPDARPTP
nr:hypothetical protein GCM10020093_052170 [Planobispora longispora]